jgi:glycosyltransferase involved in cell wall biosynthesis
MVVAVSKGVAEDLLRLAHLPSKKVRVIYNPVVTSELYRKAAEPLNHPWFGPEEPPVVLGMGRLTEQKDFPTLIHAFSYVRGELPARLMILGEGEDRSRLETLVRKFRLEGDVDLPGFVGNPFPYLKKASVFVLSSAWEGLPTVLIEALALGTPVVSTNCESGPAEILENGKWGKLVPVRNAEALARSIIEMLNQEERASPPSAVIERFTLDSAVRAYIEILGLDDGQSVDTTRSVKLP